MLSRQLPRVKEQKSRYHGRVSPRETERREKNETQLWCSQKTAPAAPALTFLKQHARHILFGQPALSLWKHSTHSVGSSTSSRRRTGGCDDDDDEDDDEEDEDAPTRFAAVFLDAMAPSVLIGSFQMRRI